MRLRSLSWWSMQFKNWERLVKPKSMQMSQISYQHLTVYQTTSKNISKFHKFNNCTKIKTQLWRSCMPKSPKISKLSKMRLLCWLQRIWQLLRLWSKSLVPNFIVNSLLQSMRSFSNNINNNSEPLRTLFLKTQKEGMVLSSVKCNLFILNTPKFSHPSGESTVSFTMSSAPSQDYIWPLL